MSQRNVYWSDLDAFNARFALREVDTFLAFTPDPTLPYADNAAYTDGSVTAPRPFDFVRVSLQAGNAYNFAADSDIWPVTLAIFDSEGYLLLFLDGDDIGSPDPERTDSILGFRPELSGTYFLYVSFTGADQGSYQVAAIEDVGADGYNGAPPVMSLDPATVVQREGDAGLTAMQFVVTRSGFADEYLTTTWSLQGSGANPADAADFEATSGTLTFSPGERWKTVTVQVRGDRVAEADESFSLSLTGGWLGTVFGNTSATGIIQDDDTNVAEFSVAPLAGRVAEGSGSGVSVHQFTIRRSEGLDRAAQFRWSVQGTGDNPADAADFQGGVLPGGIVSLAAGQAETTVTVRVLRDRAFELDETFQVVLDQFSPGSRAGSGLAIGTILNDDPVPGPPRYSLVLSPSVLEGSGGGSVRHTATLTRDGGLDQEVFLIWSIVGHGESPVDAADFSGGTLPSQFFHFESGQSSDTVQFYTRSDDLVEADESYTLLLRPHQSQTFMTPEGGGNWGVVTLFDDDDTSRVTYDITPLTQARAEGTGSGVSVVQFTILRFSDTPLQTSLSWSAIGSGANPADGTDFQGGVLPSGSLTFAAGETSQIIKVRVLRDAAQEADEAFTVVLRDLRGDVLASATATIANDDTPRPVLTMTPLTQERAEGTGSGVSVYSYEVTRQGDLSAALDLAWSATGSGASPANGSDFQGGLLPGGRLVFAAGEATQTIKVRVLRDAVLEADEGFTVALRGQDGQVLASAGGRILNDDAPAMTYTITQPSLSRAEGTGSGVALYQFTVTRAGDLSLAAQAPWSVAGHGANPADAADFLGGVLPGGMLAFAPGQSSLDVRVRVLRDAVAEADEGFALRLPGATAIGLILDDDTVRAAASSHGDLQLLG